MHLAAARRPRRHPGAGLTPAGALGAAALLAATLIATAACTSPDDDGDAAAGAGVDVVEIAAQPCDRPNRRRGIGVVVGDGLVATAAHTVEDDLRELTVDGRPGTVVVEDERTDLALVHAAIDESEVAWADTDGAPLGPAVVHLADGPLDVEIVRSGPLIVNDVTEHERHERQVHTFAPGVARGASGAPLTTTDGRLLGIVVLDRTDTEEAHAVSAGELRDLLERAGDERPAAAPACHD